MLILRKLFARRDKMPSDSEKFITLLVDVTRKSN